MSNMFDSNLTIRIADKLDLRPVWPWIYYSRLLRVGEDLCKSMKSRFMMWRGRIEKGDGV